MTRQQYDAEFKAPAVELVRRKTKPASRMAEELGVPRKTLDRWLAVGRQYPAEPFGGSGRLRADDQRVRALERTVRDLPEENAILKKPCAASPTARSTVSVHPRTPRRLLGHEDVPGAPGLPKRVLRVGAAPYQGGPGAAPHTAGADSGGLRGGRRAVWQPEDHGGPPAGGGSGGRQDGRAVNGPGGAPGPGRAPLQGDHLCRSWPPGGGQCTGAAVHGDAAARGLDRRYHL